MIDLLSKGGDFGLIGFVIAIGVGVIYFISTTFAKSLSHMFDQHREERKEWVESNERSMDKLDRSLSKLTEAIDRSKRYAGRDDKAA